MMLVEVVILRNDESLINFEKVEATEFAISLDLWCELFTIFDTAMFIC